MPVPFLDLRRLHESVRPDIDAAIERVVQGSSFIGGDEVRNFERDFGAAHDLPAGAGCGSGTDALSLALRALGIGPGDEVIVPAMTFVATAEAVSHVGAVPVVADVDPVTLLLDEASVDARRTPRTRAVIAVHLYGHVVDFDLIRAWRGSGLIVIEDAAQAHLATCADEPVGHAGDAACFSFYPGKNLGAFGDGGMVIAADADLIEEVRRLRDHGRSSKYLHDEVGWCSRLDGLQAAVLAAKLPHLAGWTAARRQVASRYRDALGERLVPWTDGAVHHLLVIRDRDRDRLQAALRVDGISTGIHYPIALSEQPWLQALGAPAAPFAQSAGAEILSLPMDPLMSDADVDEVIASVRGCAARAG